MKKKCKIDTGETLVKMINEILKFISVSMPQYEYVVDVPLP